MRRGRHPCLRDHAWDVGHDDAAQIRTRKLGSAPMSAPRPHPHFDDHGTLDWHVELEPALAEAREAGKHVFIEIGREA